MTAWLQRRVGEKVIEWRPLGALSYLGAGDESLFRCRGARLARRQCAIARDGQMFRLRDLGSRSGTLVNYRYVKEAVLVPGDVVQVGDETFSFHQRKLGSRGLAPAAEGGGS